VPFGQTDAGPSLGHALVGVGLIGRHQVEHSLAAAGGPRDRGHGQNPPLGEDQLASETVDAVSGVDRDLTVPPLPRDAEADADSPGVEAPVVEPAELADRALERRDVGGGKALAGEEGDAIEVRDVYGAVAHGLSLRRGSPG